MVTVGLGCEQLGGQPLPLDPGHRGPREHKYVNIKNRFLTSGLSPDVWPLTDGGVAGPGLVVDRAGRGDHRVESVLGVVTVLARPAMVLWSHQEEVRFIDVYLTGQITADGLGGGGADSCLGVTDDSDVEDEEGVNVGPMPGGAGGAVGAQGGAAAPQV